MLSAEHYLQLNHRLNGSNRLGVPQETTLAQIADALHCTTRNAKLVLRKLQNEGLIDWQPGLGRGNRSRLSFLSDKEQALLELSRLHAEREEYKQAFELLGLYGDGTSATARFTEWLNGRFGFAQIRGDGDRVTDTLRLPTAEPIVGLDPAECFYTRTAHMIKQLFDPLLRRDDTTLDTLPGIAHAWESSSDATVWTLHLRKGVLFHNGLELTAEDVVFSLERLRYGRRNSWMLRSLLSIEAPSLRKVVIRLTRPNRIFLHYLSSIPLSVLPKGFAGQTENDFWKRPIGTGPFRVTEWTEKRFVMQANAAYYLGRPHLDQVVIVTVPAPHTSDSLWQRILGEAETKVNSIDPLQAAVSRHYTTHLIVWNRNKDGPQRSKLLRQAIDNLLDRRQMVRELNSRVTHDVSEDTVIPAVGFFPRKVEEEAVPDTDCGWSSGREQAQALLAQSGMSPPSAFKIQPLCGRWTVCCTPFFSPRMRSI
ncbi:ABC transporter substrate-binding protein [Paenibacillus sp. NPDC058071]|uniref:ABC transporter substrate-binding protein n=1 Tax=Paenibacillus sp. NPDC058071 TaxID=3346326 RepID=UPI0036DBC6CB